MFDAKTLFDLSFEINICVCFLSAFLIPPDVKLEVMETHLFTTHLRHFLYSRKKMLVKLFIILLLKISELIAKMKKSQEEEEKRENSSDTND